MANNKVVVEFEIDDKNSSKAIDNLSKKTTDVGKKAKESGEKASKSFKDMAMKIGKSLGIIGLVAGAINVVKDALAGNQKVVDFFAAAMGTLSDIVRDAFNFITDNAGAVVDYFKAIFEDPIGSLEEMGNAIKENIIERFESWLEMFGHIGKAIKHLFAGEWTEAWNAAKEAGSEAVDVLTGVDNTIGKVTDAVVSAAEAVGSYVKKTFDANVELVKLQNNAKLAAAEQARLAEQYDRQAELLRQARDDERKSIEDRIKANNELADVLDKQEKAELAAANAQVAAAQSMLEHNKTIDNQVALTQALANADGVRAKIAGLRSEQQMNDLALSKEKNDLLKTEAEATNQLSIESQRFYAERVKGDVMRLEALKYVLGEERKLELARLQEQINAHAEGTQARLEAQIAYNQKQQEFTQQEIALDDQLKEAKKKNAKEKEEIERQLQEKNYQMAVDAIGSLIALNDAFPANSLKNAKKSFKINKSLQLAQAGISAIQAVQSVLADPTLVGPARFIAAAAAGITGAANVAKIAKTTFDSSKFDTTTPSGGGGGGMGALGGGGGSTSAPALDLSFLNNQQTKAQPIQSYVLATNVTSAQDAQQKILDQSKLIK